MKRTITCWSSKYSINEFIINVKKFGITPYLSNVKWHPTDLKVKITIEKVKETKK